jgi:predicted CoA-binding protein/GNAT superfamily N-acetyltransferase
MLGISKYPAHLETDLVLRDGTTVHVRPARPEDQPRVVEFLRSLSEESRLYRFFAALGDAALAEGARRMCDVDYEGRMALVATAGPEERVVAHGMYALRAPGRAEVAVVVADPYQGRGLGTLLLGQLAEIAAAKGIEVFEAEVLPENHRMVRVLRDLGFPAEVRAGAGELLVTFPTRFTPEAVERFEQRERIAAANALSAILRPKGVAVVGASRDRQSIPGQLFWNLLRYGFSGAVYPVNPQARVVQGVQSYPSVEAIPETVDLAVIAAPAEHVAEVARQCARKGVRALVVISAGFAEAGPEGATSGGAPAGLPGKRHALGGTELHGGGEHPSRGPAAGHLRASSPAAGTRGIHVSERRARAGGLRVRGARGAGSQQLRVRGEQSGHLGQ